VKRDETPEGAEHTAPPPKAQQDLQQARGHRGRDPDTAERGRPDTDVPDAPRDLPPQEPPD